MGQEGGYIKLWRKLLLWEWYSDVNTTRVFVHLLLSANHRDGSWKGINVKRGQLVTSTTKLPNEVNLSRQKVRTALNNLKSTGEITIKATSRYTLITVENYSIWQSGDDVVNQRSNQQITNGQPANNQQITTNKNEKNVKNEKNKRNIKDIIVEYTENPELSSALSDFAEMRKQIKAPLTDRGLSGILKKLDGMAINDAEKIAILEQSIERSWRGVFPIKKGEMECDKKYECREDESL